MKGIYPAPVYVAEFAGGETIRMSFWSPKNKPLTARAPAVRAWLAGIIGGERDAEASKSCGAHSLGSMRVGCGAVAPAEAWFASTAGRRFLRSIAAQLVADVCGARVAAKLFRSRIVSEPATDMIAGHIEHDGQVIADPFFAPVEVLPMMRKRQNKREAALIEAAKQLLAAFGDRLPGECAAARDVIERMAA